jgi:hypothetical protein
VLERLRPKAFRRKRASSSFTSPSSPFRRWPAESFAEAIADLAGSAEDRRIVVTAGPSKPARPRIVAARAPA